MALPNKQTQQAGGGAGTYTLIAAGTNVNGIIIWSAQISNCCIGAAAASGTSTFDDYITDGTVNYLGSFIGQNGPGTSGHNNAEMEYSKDGIVVPAGRAIQLNASATALNVSHRCTATVCYTVL